MLRILLGFICSFPLISNQCVNVTHPLPNSPIIVHTWPWTEAAEAAWKVLRHERGTALDAVQHGAARCEELQCGHGAADGTVGFGGSPDENGETTLDALIMDGDTMAVGAVADLRHIKEAVQTARLVLEHTQHTLLAGIQASQFAHQMGLKPSNLTTEESARLHNDWVENNCQPNFRKNVVPDPKTSCGPYKRRKEEILLNLKDTGKIDSVVKASTARALLGGNSGNKIQKPWPSESAHDTISLIALDSKGSMAAACSTNGAIFKVPGRVGDSPIPGGGSYVDSEVGGCGATGDGDAHLRFLPCYQVVESMRQGMTPKEAAEDAIKRIVKKLKGQYVGAVVAVSKSGEHAAASYGWDFSYSYRDETSDGVRVVKVEALKI